MEGMFTRKKTITNFSSFEQSKHGFQSFYEVCFDADSFVIYDPFPRLRNQSNRRSLVPCITGCFASCFVSQFR
ncbi:hypothetical protein L596_007078 [Steinernema carpocapsae]|uniref:Uncharacterized protein n=1 Tax=Steinernema carpocapsae TaxID=34508 RepID=A0A4V6A5V5_STECR|nr:hypothetical protein L596_007078 [Steinernema carpocapsae]